MMVTRQYYFEVYERHADTVKKLGRLINWVAGGKGGSCFTS